MIFFLLLNKRRTCGFIFILSCLFHLLIVKTATTITTKTEESCLINQELLVNYKKEIFSKKLFLIYLFSQWSIERKICWNEKWTSSSCCYFNWKWLVYYSIFGINNNKGFDGKCQQRRDQKKWRKYPYEIFSAFSVYPKIINNNMCSVNL